MMKSYSAEGVSLKLILIGGLMLGVVALLIDMPRGISLSGIRHRPEHCEGEVNEAVVISREQLAQFLTISERDTKARVQDILQAPYCQLPLLRIRAGVDAERAVYPLAFDPHTWLVVLYEGDEYAGYQFRFQR